MNSAPSEFVNSRDFARIARAIRFIDAEYARQPRLNEIARACGLSEFHFSRLFTRWAGISPKQYLQVVTGRAALRALHEEGSVLDAAHAVGLSGTGRLHDLMVTLEAMTPGELRAGGSGLAIRWGQAQTPFGDALIAATDRGICQLLFVDSAASAAAALHQLQRRFPAASLRPDAALARELAQRAFRRAAQRGASLNVLTSGTNFQTRVWKALLAQAADTVVDYGDLAAELGSGARAVGQAVGGNSIAWLIPCHHVLRRDGELGGYRWGVDRKRAMLAWESISPAASARIGQSG